MNKSPILPTVPFQGGDPTFSSQDGAQAVVDTEPKRPEVLTLQAVNRSSVH